VHASSLAWSSALARGEREGESYMGIEEKRREEKSREGEDEDDHGGGGWIFLSVGVG
jgi:hypothetical protein